MMHVTDTKPNYLHSMFARSVFRGDDGLMSISSIFTDIEAEVFPTIESFFLINFFQGNATQADLPLYEMTIQALNNMGMPIGTTRTKLLMKNTVFGIAQGTAVIEYSNVTIDQPGMVVFEIVLEGKLLGKWYLEVHEIKT